MHTEQQIQDIGLLNKGLQLLNIDVALQPGVRMNHAVACRFMNNPDGSLKWLWPASARKPQMLRFHNVLNQGGERLARKVRASFRLGMPGLVSGKTTIYTTAIGQRQLQRLADWAIYTGQEGVNRKLVIWHEDKAGQAAFTKLSLSIYAAKNIYTERIAIQQPTPDVVVVPETIVTRCLAFTQQDLSGIAHSPLQTVADLPVTAMQQWLGYDLRMHTLSEASWYCDAQSWLQTARPGKDERISEVLLQKMRTLIDCMLPQAKVPVSRAHGDFSPWNARRIGDKIALIDWQHSRDDMPALYDLFHFIYQSNILIKGKPFAAIRKEIDELLRLPEWETFLLERDIDAGEAEQQYLLCAISTYLQEYAQLKQGNKKAALLMQVWCEALGFWMDYEGLLTQRQIVLQDVAHFLHDKQYAAIMLCASDITALPLSADLNLCMPAAVTSALADYLRRHRCIERIREKRRTATREISIFLSGGSAIHLQCMSELRSRNLVLANAPELCKGTRLNEAGIRQPAVADDLRYTRLQYLLSGTTIPQQYRNHYLSLSVSTQFELMDQMHEEGMPSTRSFAAMLQYDDAARRQSIAFLKAQTLNKGFSGLWRRMQYGVDMLRNLLPQQGFIITFSGVDGAGKRTVIEATRHRINQELRMPVMVLPHRPSLLPISGRQESAKRSIAKLPQRPATRSLFQTRLRPLYYVDYLLGQAYVHLRYVMRGYVVLYDHYFDFTNSNDDSNVILPAAFTTWWYRFLLKPDLNFLLYAPSEVILERKQELSAESIEHLTGQYLALFAKLERRSGQGHYISVRNLRLGETVETLFQHIKTRQEGAAA